MWHLQVNDCCGNDSNQNQELVLGIFCQAVTCLHCWELLTDWQTDRQEQHSLILTLALDRFVYGCAGPMLGLLLSDHTMSLYLPVTARLGLGRSSLGVSKQIVSFSVKNRCNTTHLLVSCGGFYYSRNGPVFLFPEPTLKQVIISFPLPVSSTVWGFPNCTESFNAWGAWSFTVVQIIPQQMIIPHSSNILTAGKYDSAIRLILCISLWGFQGAQFIRILGRRIWEACGVAGMGMRLKPESG